MKYAAQGASEFVDWGTAAKRGGVVPTTPSSGQHRSYAVDAYVTFEDEDGQVVDLLVNGKWFTELGESAQKQVLRELGLPIKAGLAGKLTGPRDSDSQTVCDFRIIEVWDGWCGVTVKYADGEIGPNPVHSMHLSELNKGSSIDKTPGEQATLFGDEPPVKALRKFESKAVKKADDMPLNFIVFDLETTGRDQRNCDICEIGALKVESGRTVASFERLVYIDGEMPYGAQKVHHIDKGMLGEAPHMKSALADFLDFIGTDAVLVGHNIVGYDLPIMDRVADACGLAFDFAEAIDTLALAKSVWPGRASYKMDVLRDILDLSFTDAHRAVKDCEDELALYLKEREALADPSARIAAKPQARKSSARPGSKFNAHWNDGKAKDITTSVTDFDTSHPLYGKHVVITGDVEGFESRPAVWQAIKDLGGEPQDNVTKKTDLLVNAEPDGVQTGKIKKALQYGTRIITAAKFVAALDGKALD